MGPEHPYGTGKWNGREECPPWIVFLIFRNAFYHFPGHLHESPAAATTAAAIAYERNCTARQYESATSDVHEGGHCECPTAATAPGPAANAPARDGGQAASAPPDDARYPQFGLPSHANPTGLPIGHHSESTATSATF